MRIFSNLLISKILLWFRGKYINCCILVDHFTIFHLNVECYIILSQCEKFRINSQCITFFISEAYTDAFCISCYIGRQSYLISEMIAFVLHCSIIFLNTFYNCFLLVTRS
ncbi:hypothetical protein BGV46_25860 [Serratia marcescens]|nr:hypothetical protein BGV46_25860 [Serratia marcescens]